MHYPQVEFVLWVGTADLVLEGWLDSGFEGGVSIPSLLQYEILAEAEDTMARLADGSQIDVPTWSGKVELMGHSYLCEVIATGKQVLIGLEVMNRLEVTFSHGRSVRLRFPDGLEHVQSY